MPANFGNSAVATGLEKVNFHSNPKERKCQRMLKLSHNCIHLTHYSLTLKARWDAWAAGTGEVCISWPGTRPQQVQPLTGPGHQITYGMPSLIRLLDKQQITFSISMVHGNRDILKIIQCLRFQFNPISWDFPGSPVVKTLCFLCKGGEFNLWSAN